MPVVLTHRLLSVGPVFGKGRPREKDERKPIAKQMTLPFGRKPTKPKTATTEESQETADEDLMDTQETQTTGITLVASTQIEEEPTQTRTPPMDDDPIVEDQDQEVRTCPSNPRRPVLILSSISDGRRRRTYSVASFSRTRIFCGRCRFVATFSHI